MRLGEIIQTAEHVVYAALYYVGNFGDIIHHLEGAHLEYGQLNIQQFKLRKVDIQAAAVYGEVYAFALIKHRSVVRRASQHERFVGDDAHYDGAVFHVDDFASLFARKFDVGSEHKAEVDGGGIYRPIHAVSLYRFKRVDHVLIVQNEYAIEDGSEQLPQVGGGGFIRGGDFEVEACAQ